MVTPQALEDRLHRARSWICAAKALGPNQHHAEFIFLYIAFNALFGRRQYEGSKEEQSKDRQEFIDRVSAMSVHGSRAGDRLLQRALQACQEECGELILNYFLRDTYWRKEKTSRELKAEFIRQRYRAEKEFRKGRWNCQLELVLRRLAVLRNQILHGCVTYGTSSKGLPSLLAGLAVLRQIVPALYELMAKYGHHVTWPAIPYPRVGSEAHPMVDVLQ
jgi:hypothetical protein